MYVEESLWDLGSRSRSDLNLWNGDNSYIHFCKNCFWKILSLYSHTKAQVIKLFVKIGWGQSRVIIWTNYDKPKSPMLHNRFHGIFYFQIEFTIYGHGSHAGHVTIFICINFYFQVRIRICQVASEKTKF